jgi:hypothetical protein
MQRHPLPSMRAHAILRVMSLLCLMILMQQLPCMSRRQYLVFRNELVAEMDGGTWSAVGQSKGNYNAIYARVSASASI